MICNCRTAYILVCIWETFWNVMHAYMHAQFAALMTLPTTEPRRMPIVSCALIYDTAIRVSAVTADRTGKFALLTYSLTAYHCSTEARLTGVQFPPSFDSRLVLRQSVRKSRLMWMQDWSGWPKRWPSLDQVIQMRARKTPLTALDCYSNNPEHLTCSPFCLRAVLISSPDTRVERGRTRWL